MSEYVRRFQDLEVYEMQRAVSRKVFETCDFEALTDNCERIGRMLGSLIQKADKFTSTDHRLKEKLATYLTNG